MVMWMRKKMIAGLSAPPELDTSTVIADQSRAICARARASNAAVASGRVRCIHRSTAQQAAL